MSQNDLIIPLLPFTYKYGFTISNDATTPHTVLDIAAGQCRDSNNVIDMGIGTLYPPGDQGIAVSAPVLLNAAINGLNGLDTGSLADSTMYAIYVIGDSTYKKQVGTIATLASNSVPLLPFGYDSYRLIGYWATNGSAQWLSGYYTGTGGGLRFTYDAAQATSVTAGAATSYTAVSLLTLVPPINNIVVNIGYAYTPNAASHTFKMQGVNETGDGVTITGQVASVVVSGNTAVLAQLATATPEINYKVSNSSDAVAINVVGFEFSV